jgi:7-cyano-7-deazaguanine reductase
MKNKIEGITKLGSKKTKYQLNNPNISILETFENKHKDQIYLVSFTMPRDEFASLCPITGQPDQAKIEILYVPDIKMIESKSLKLYLFAYRNHGSFHEDIINKIAKDLYKLLDPFYIRVFGDFSPRGGIAIKPMVEKWNERKTGKNLMIIDRLILSWEIKGIS